MSVSILSAHQTRKRPISPKGGTARKRSIHSPHFGLSNDSEYNKSNHISCLLPEILTYIFTFLDLVSKRKVSQVCQLWKDSAYDRQVWKDVEVKIHLIEYSPTLVQSLVRRGIKSLQILSFKTSLKSYIFDSLTSFETLNLRGCYKLSDSSIRYLSTKDLSSLTSLNISLCKEITDSSLILISSKFSKLEDLDISSCSNVTWIGIKALSSLKNLQVLKMGSLKHLTDDCIQFISGKSPESPGLYQLTHLDLQNCQRIKDESLLSISRGLKSLRFLNLNFCLEVTDSGLLHLAKLSELRHLSLRLCSNVGDMGVGYLSSGSCKLQSLDLSFCDLVTDQSLVYLSQAMFQLQTLSLCACSITDEGLTCLTQSISSLKVLYLGQCNKLTDRCIEQIKSNLPQLEQIDLYGCLNISKEKKSSLQLMPSLKRLKLDI